VLGYAYLMRVKTKDAKEAFEKAIVLDQADPLPRMGLGLAKIREGKLHDGGREIETAASLDPSNAIVRSYLGKTYYEEKRTGLDEREYEMAKQLDPNDPTPYFYGAIAKQTTNRPVEALHDMQKAIELNDNRAVYRSRLLLDSDEASRSAAQGRIYSDLGFQQLALVEGWKSVNTDQTNFSAHRLLADSYATLPRHEIARVSELLQSQLLQPLNITPIQPRLVESNLFLISAGGPGALSFNEFNPVFNRDGIAFQVSGLGGENDTWSGEGVIAGIYGKASFSAGYSHFETDGFRPNADQTDDIVTALVQLQLTPSTSVQAEYRHRELETGDLQQRFFREDFFPGRRNKEVRDALRLGARHAFAPDSIMIGSLTFSRAEFSLFDNQLLAPVSWFRETRPEDALSLELQHLFKSRYVSLTAGGGYFHVNGEAKTRVMLEPAALCSVFAPVLGSLTNDCPLRFNESTDLDHGNLYAYSYITPVRQLMLTLGFSADFVSGDAVDIGDINQFNPKFGVTWNPLPGTTFRAAAFRTLKRTLITDQTIEPTQVAGFNQLFDDFNGTEAWRYGGAIDQKFTRDLFGGVEYSRRDLKIRFADVSTGQAQPGKANDNSEDLARAYLFWTPLHWLALRAEYTFERFEYDESLQTDFPSDIRTHRVPLGVNFYHPSGFSTSLTATYWHQEVDDLPPFFVTDPLQRSGTESFWTLDASASYRLPLRYGFVTVGATNLTNKKFRYYETDRDNPRIQPERMVFGRVTLAFP
jgi:tetratricopeptide (TPR) repeat protein